MGHPDDLKKVQIRKEQAATVRVIGERMRQARELCNLSQGAAARRLGYANPSKLSKVEAATDTNSVPLWLIHRASDVYEVSIDYLFGITDDWEVGARMTQEREISAWLADMLNRARERDLAVYAAINARMDILREAITAMAAATDESSAAMARFCELNSDFDEMRGSNRLVMAVNRACDSAAHGKARLARFKMDCKLAATGLQQLSFAI